MDNSQSAVVALDIGGTKIPAGLLSNAEDVLPRKAENTVQISLAESLDQISRLIQQIVEAAPATHCIDGVGVAVPGWERKP